MKRLGFKPQFKQDILDGKKRCTIRKSPIRLYTGDIVSAVSGKAGKPDFLIPASEGFATIEITNVADYFWKDITDEMANKSGVTRQWYIDTYGAELCDYTRMVVIEFKVVKP